MTAEDPLTHGQSVDRLQAIIAQLRHDVEARSDRTLEDIARALDIVVQLVTHTHEHALDNRARIERLERAQAGEPSV